MPLPPPTTSPLPPTVAALLHLQQRLATVNTSAALGFTAVNETRFLVEYQQAALWEALDPRRGRIHSLSGLPVVDPEAPYIQWLAAVLGHLASQSDQGVRLLRQKDLPPALGRAWQEWLPEQGLWLPLTLPALEGEGRAPLLAGGLFLVRTQPWSTAEQQLLTHLGLGLAPIWWNLRLRRPLWQRLWTTRPPWLSLLWIPLTVGVLAMPVQQSVLAPAEVVAVKPAVLRAPMDGVVDEFFVLPNQSVTSGQTLLSLDTRALRNRLEIALKEWEVAQAEHRHGVQSALQDPRSKARLALLLGRVQQQEAELAHIRHQLERVVVVAPRDGVAVFSDETDWIGKPVKVGERLLMLANPQQVELEIQLPVADAIVWQPGSPVTLFPAGDGRHTLSARLRYASYRAELSPEGVLSYTLLASFTDGQTLPRLGGRGTAKIFAEEVSLLYYLFRRPLATARQWLGL
ncbi:MAG: HlyD family efflux transporter periplasmic adaptor subunit [Magnetococcales bacterium]|nr:HlyD family efflux transporter periplasmic adaptor subunit [Magnetococcales bacterium]